MKDLKRKMSGEKDVFKKIKHGNDEIVMSNSIRNLDNNENNVNLLSTKNKHMRDDRIRFREEDHKYWIDDDDKDVLSCTTFIHYFFNEFDADLIIKRILRSKKYDTDPSYKYYKMSSDNIKKMWSDNGKQAADEGTYNHLQIELFYNNLKHDDTKKEFKMFKIFDESLGNNMIPWRTEMMVFHDILRLSGSIDMIFKDKSDNKYVLFDWKFCKEISKTKNSNGYGKGELNKVRGTNFYKYSLQLSLYKRILEEYYDMDIKDMYLIVLHKTQNEYKKIKVDDMQKEITYMFGERKKELLTYEGYEDVTNYNVNFYDL